MANYEPDSVLSILTMSSFTFIVIFLSYLFFHVNRTRPILVNWPVIGMLGGVVANHDRLLDYATTVLRESGCNIAFKGPWFTGMNFILTCDPANANHMFNTNSTNYLKGDDFRQIFDILGNGIFNADGHLWRLQRRMAHACMNSPRFQNMVAKCSREKVSSAVLPLLGGATKSVDLHDVFKRFTFDITCNLVLGVDPCSLSPDYPAIPFGVALDDAEEGLLLRHTMPKFWWKLKRGLGVGSEKSMAAAKIVIDQFIAQCIIEKRDDPRKNHTSSGLLSLYLHLDPNCNNEDIDTCLVDYFRSDEFLRDSLLTFLGAGKDTTSSALSWFFHLVSTNPDVEKRILNEICSVRSSLLESWTVFDVDEIEGLVYLHAALCEALRLYPPVPFNHKCALKEDVLPSGHKLKPGTMIIFSTYAMGRMEHVWGKDCLEFKPERWITDDGKLKHEPSYKFLAFHSGPRTCLGKNMAFIEMKVAAAAIIYNFHIEPVEGHVVEPKLSITLPMKNGLMVKVRKREKIEG